MLMSDCFFYNRKTAYEMRISDWSSDVCSSNLLWATRTKSGSRAGIYGGEIHRESCGKSGSAKRAQGHVGDGAPARFQLRSEERRVGKECVSTGRYRWLLHH